MSNEKHTVRCRHCWELISMPSPGCIECSRFKPAVEPWRDPCAFGGAMVGSEPMHDPFAELKSASAFGRDIQIRNSAGEWHDLRWIPIWDMPLESYRIKPVPVANDLAARLFAATRGLATVDHLRQALRDEGVTDPAMVMHDAPINSWSHEMWGVPTSFKVVVDVPEDKASIVYQSLLQGKARLQIVRVP